MKMIYREIFREIRPSMRSLFGIGIIIFFAACVDTLIPWPFKFLIDDILKYGDGRGASLPFESFFQNTTNPLFLALGFIALYLCIMFSSMIFEYAYGVKLKKHIHEIVRIFSLRVFRSIESMSLEKYRSKDVGDYIYRLGSETAALGEIIETVFLQGVLSLFYIVAAFAVMLYLDATLAFVSLIALPLFILIITYFGKKLGMMRRQAERSTSLLFSFLEEALVQLKNIQAFGQEAREAIRFNKNESTVKTNEFRVEKMNFLFHLILGAIVACVYGIVISIGIYQVQNSIISAGILILFMFYLDNLTHPLLSFLEMFTVIRDQSIVLERVYALISKSPTAPNVVSGLCASGDISFHNVSLMVGNGVFILRNISFVIPQNKITVIVGSNGSGKSTLLSLLMGFILPTSGFIRIGVQDISALPVETVRMFMAYVPQEVVLFDDTIGANIAFGSSSYDKKNVLRASRLANADGFILKKNEGFSFGVGNDGLKLSGGQRQKILLARAFARTAASCVLLDEPFSSLDIRSVTHVISSLRMMAKNKTIIIVSNSLEILSCADRVILLDNGRMQKCGAPRDVLKKTIARKYFSLM